MAKDKKDKKEKKKEKKGKKGKAGKKQKPIPPKHVLYEASVQGVDADLDFITGVYRRRRNKLPRLIREDFCGTALLACEWVRRNGNNRAWGVDLHQPTLDWGIEHHVSKLSESAQRRLTLINDNVLTVKTPRVDILMAQNYSYWVFKERRAMLDYFRRAHEALKPDGAFCLDLFGGTESMVEVAEETKIEGCRGADGTKVPDFTYVWDQAKFNPVTNEILCYIHFELPGKRQVRRAFTYDWRLWTVAELRDLLEEAGFASSDVYTEGWDEKEEEGDGVFRKRTKFENQEMWLAYIVAWR